MAQAPAPPLSVPGADKAVLEAVIRAPTSEQRLVTRARIVLRSAEGIAMEHVARELGVAFMTVKLWRRRYAEAGLAGLADRPRPGHPPTYGREDRDRLLALTLGPPPEGTTHWSVRSMAAASGMSPSTVHRLWSELGLKPHRTETFKFSTDPALEAKVRDIVGLYLDPPDGAVVLSVDEKTQIQALDRTQPMLPMRPGQAERHTHDYKRHGTTCLFAALEVGSGAVTTDHRARHTGADFLAFMKRVARAYPRASCTSCSTTSPPTRPPRSGLARAEPAHHLPLHAHQRLLDEPGRDVVRHPHPPRYPAGQLRQRQGAHRHDRCLHPQLERGASPFVWVKTADAILAKAVRKRPANSESGH